MPEQVKGMPVDAGFVRRIVRRDVVAFEALYDEFAPLVFGQLLEMVGDRQIAEELLVETFFRAWSQAASFDEHRAALPRWLLGIARELADEDCQHSEPVVAKVA